LPKARLWLKRFIFSSNTLVKKPLEGNKLTREEFKNACFSFGITPGDILLVHSTSDIHIRLGLNPAETITFLKDLVGESGTLAMPCFPIINGNPKGLDSFKDLKYENQLTYNVQKNSPWTGILAKQLMQTPGSLRSRNPINSMIALGPHADEMMRHNLESPYKPHGIGSSWHYCFKNNAKILMLNCSPAHTLTMVHLKEDIINDWPIPSKNWYRKRNFIVQDGKFNQEVTVLERSALWNCFFVEQNLSFKLSKSGILMTKQLENINLSSCESNELCEFLDKSKDIVFPYKIPNFIKFLFK